MTEGNEMTDLADMPTATEGLEDLLTRYVEGDEEMPDIDLADADAETFMQRIARARARLAARTAEHAAYVERANAWKDAATERDRRSLDFHLHQLVRFMLLRRQRDGRAKSLALPSGTARTTERGAVVHVDDEDAVLAWLATTDDEIRAKALNRPKVSTSGLRSVVTAVEHHDGEWIAVCEETGERVPGVRVDPPSISCSVTTNTADAFGEDAF